MRGTIDKRQLTGLDALRGIGITGIVLYHLFPAVFPGGFLGVPLFFVLSGYLMFVTSSNAWNKGKFLILGYYRRRMIKIFPPLFTMVMAICCYLTLFHRSQLAGMRGEILSIFLGYDNWWQISQNASYFSKMANASLFTHLWFLAVELQFYLIWPFLFLFYQKGCQVIGGKKMCFLFFGLALLSAGRMLLLYTPGSDPSRVYYGTDTMAFPLLIGMFLGAVMQQYGHFHLSLEKWHTALFSVLFVLTICILFITVDGQDDFVYQGGMLFISLFFASVVCFVGNHGKTLKDMLPLSLISLIGKKSYLVYLWHYPLIIAVHLV